MGQAKRLARIALLLAAVVYLAAVAVHGFAAWLLDHPRREDLERAARWDPGNPFVWTAQGRYWLFSPQGFQPAKAVEAYLRAASLNPFDAQNWDGLANAYFQLGDTRKAEAALRSAVFASPQSPAAAWRLANLLLVTGRSEEAYSYLRVVARSSRQLRSAVFDLAWKAVEDPAAVFSKVIPSDAECLGDYLRFLIARKKLSEGEQVWRALRAPGSTEVRQLGSEYAEALAGAGRGETARRVWNEVLADSGRDAARRPADFVTNGDFELDMPNAGLDWRFGQRPGYELSIDNLVAQHGTRSLRITFDGSANVDFNGIWQFVPVRPNRQYRFHADVKLDTVTTDQGIIFCIVPVAAPPAEQFSACTENRIGTENWTLHRLDFRTGPNTSVVLLQVRRRASQKFDNLIRGKVWIDDVAIEQM